MLCARGAGSCARGSGSIRRHQRLGVRVQMESRGLLDAHCVLGTLPRLSGAGVPCAAVPVPALPSAPAAARADTSLLQGPEPGMLGAAIMLQAGAESWGSYPSAAPQS